MSEQKPTLPYAVIRESGFLVFRCNACSSLHRWPEDGNIPPENFDAALDRFLTLMSAHANWILMSEVDLIRVFKDGK